VVILLLPRGYLLFIQVYCPYATLGYERPTPHFLTDINIHSATQAEPRKLSSLTLYIDLWQEGKPAPGQNPPVISPPVVIFRRIGVRAEIRTQNPVLSNTRLAKMVPLSHLRRQLPRGICCHSLHTLSKKKKKLKKAKFWKCYTFPHISNVFSWLEYIQHAKIVGLRENHHYPFPMSASTSHFTFAQEIRLGVDQE
jgi:hypothetical protein